MQSLKQDSKNGFFLHPLDGESSGDRQRLPFPLVIANSPENCPCVKQPPLSVTRVGNGKPPGSPDSDNYSSDLRGNTNATLLPRVWLGLSGPVSKHRGALWYPPPKADDCLSISPLASRGTWISSILSGMVHSGIPGKFCPNACGCRKRFYPHQHGLHHGTSAMS